MTQPNTSDSVDFNLAQKLYDQYIEEAETRREEILANANSEAEGILTRASETATRLTEEAESNSQRVQALVQEEVDKKMASLEEETVKLEERIAGLRKFELDYKESLRKLIEKSQAILDGEVAETPAEANVEVPDANVEEIEEDVVDDDGYNYHVEWSEEDGSFVATVKEFPSLSWTAETEEEALSSLRELIRTAN